MFGVMAPLFGLFLLINAFSVALSDDKAADQAVQQLLEGNHRFQTGHSLHPNQDLARLRAIRSDQHPIAVILNCSDSRQPPEIIFDQGLGKLFDVRTAGNTVDDLELGSIEYAVEHLGVSLIVVLGHQSCGAVTMAVRHEQLHDHLSSIVRSIRPALKNLPPQCTEASFIDAAIRANVLYVVHRLSISEPVLKEAFQNHAVKIIGAYYDLETGAVSLLSH